MDYVRNSKFKKDVSTMYLSNSRDSIKDKGMKKKVITFWSFMQLVAPYIDIYQSYVIKSPP